MSALDTPPPSAAELEAMRAAEAELAASPAAPVPQASDEECGVKRIMILPLLNEHSALIEALRAACQAELNSDPDPVMTTHYNDNVFLLRFLISAKFKLEKAINAVKTTIAWRNKNREMLARMRAGEPIPGAAEFQKLNIAAEHYGRMSLDGAPVLIIRSALSDLGAVIDRIDRQYIYNTMVFTKERQYILCDQLSRQKGYLVKLVSIMDLAHASFTKALDRRWFKLMGEIQKEVELCYPQLLGANVIMNAPGWVKLAMGIAGKFLPASTMEKMVLDEHKVPTYDAKRKGVDIVKNPYAWARFVAPENIPTFLGGTCKCHANERFPNGRCIVGIDNDRKTMVTEKPLPQYE